MYSYSSEIVIKDLINHGFTKLPSIRSIVKKNNYRGHTLNKGDIIMFASVGAGMNINAITYKI